MCVLVVFGSTGVSKGEVDCVSSPDNSQCQDFRFPGSESVVVNFCNMMDNMPGCTVYHTCQNAAYNASTGGNGVCSFFSLASDLCADMPGMDRAACTNLTAMCHPTTGTSQVRECQTPTLVATLPTFMRTKGFINGLCSSDAPSQALCDQCISNNWHCDMLTVYTELCALAPDRVECSAAKTYCTAVQSYHWPMCASLNAPMAMPMHMHPPTAAPTTTTPGNLDCPRTPSNPACTNYRIANPAGVVKDMCDMMDNMPACSVKGRVCTQKKFSSSPYCTDSSLMADVCTDMTMGVTGCVDYVDMCVSGSVVAECSEVSLKTVLPTYSEAKGYVTGICSSMSMSDCNTCKSGAQGDSCDYLTVYSNLCMAMPSMTQCSAWSKFCKAVPDWPYCSIGESGIPEMRMYFHMGMIDYVLFKGWVPRNGVQYAFTWIGIAVAGVLLEAIKFFRAKMEKRWLENHSHLFVTINTHHDTEETAARPETQPWHWKVDLPRSILATVELGWGYMLMLVAMTFNVGLFLAVLFGCFLGTLIFGRFLVSLPKAKAVSCH